MQLRKATRQRAKIRLGLSAASGGGKTVSALLIAYGITGDWSKIAVIDTENGSADLYANHTLPNGFTIGEFQVLPFPGPYPPESYIKAIKACEVEGMEVVIIDSITHEWDGDGGILRIADSIPGDNFTKWKVLTPRHQAFIDTILKSPAHIITTVRRKQEYALTKDETTGKNRVEKLGLREITREGFDYELTLNFELDQNHNAWVNKDRTGLFDGKPFFVPSPETGRIIAEWCESGEDITTLLQGAIEKTKACNTEKELELLVETTPVLVSQHTKFLEAVKAKSAEIVMASSAVIAGQIEATLAKVNTPEALTALIEDAKKLAGPHVAQMRAAFNAKATEKGWHWDAKAVAYVASAPATQAQTPDSNPPAATPTTDTKQPQQAASTPAPAPARRTWKPTGLEAMSQTKEWFEARIGKRIWMQGAIKNTDHYTGPYPETGVLTDAYPDYLVTMQHSEGYTFRDLTPEEEKAAAA